MREEVAMWPKMPRIALPLAVAALLAPAFSRAQDDWTTDPEQPGATQQAPAEPNRNPPPPPAAQPAPPPQQASAPPGQWVYTAQYGWVWMPYASSYTYLPPGGAYPLMYVYYPVYGWTWLEAPWVWGVGPWPWFGVSGGVRFVWYHPYRPYYPYYRPYAPYWRPYRAVPWRAAPPPGVRAGVVRSAPVVRGGVVAAPHRAAGPRPHR